MKMKERIVFYDTTLRDGAQSEEISYTIEDKVKIARKLDEFGMDYIEGGWPFSNPKDTEFFEVMRHVKLSHSRLTAFGSTCRANVEPKADPNLNGLINCGTPTLTIFGKSWDMHVIRALQVELEENIRMIAESVAYLKQHADEVIYDAEHFFDGFAANPEYAKQTLAAAINAGADVVVLCDTNGGSLPHIITQIVRGVRQEFPNIKLGIHSHNDSECGVANAIVAVQDGCTHIQGTINGFGERCGNANLTSVIPALALKQGYDCLLPNSLKHLTALSNYIDELANVTPFTRQAYVGRSAFAHKGGVHADAVAKYSHTYEHIRPEQVGNKRRILISELSGGSAIVDKAHEMNFDLTKESPSTRRLIKQVASLENEGYSFEGAEGSFEILVQKALGTYQKLFEVRSFRIIVERREDFSEPITEATLKLAVDGEEIHCVAEGDGPIHALDSALRKALIPFFPELENIRLTDFRVRVVNLREGTAAKVRTIIELDDGQSSWNCVGVSTNLIEASWHALTEAVECGLLRISKYRPNQ